MTNQVKDTVSCVNKLVEISEKINEFKDNKEDVEELIKIMGYSSKIESVLDWLMGYEESPISTDVLHTNTNLKPFKLPDLAREMARAKQSQILEMTEGDSATNGIDEFMYKFAQETVDKAFEGLPSELKPKLIDKVKVGDDIDNAPKVSYTVTVKEPENPIAYDPNPPSLIQIGKLENSSSESAITLNGEPVAVEEENVNPYAAAKDEVVPDDTQEMYDDEEESSAPPVVDLNGPNLDSYKHLPQELLNKVIANYDKHSWLKHDKDAEWKRNEEYPLCVLRLVNSLIS